MNDGHAVFRDTGQTFGAGGTGLAIGDVNGDGYADVIAPSPASTLTGSAQHFAYLNDGMGHFTELTQAFNTFHSTDVKLADLNGDGYLDAIVLQDSSSISSSAVTNLSRVYFNDGQGNFAPSPTIIGDFGTNSSGNVLAGTGIAVTDLDNDKDLDLVLAQGIRGPFQFWFNRSVLGPIKGLSSNIGINDEQTATPFIASQLNAPVGSSLAVSVALDNAPKGVFTPGSLASSGFSGPVNGAYTLNATNPAAAQAALRGLVFAPTPNRVPVGSTEVTHFTIVVSDGTNTRQDTSTGVTALSINDPPLAIDDQGAGFTTTQNAAFKTTNVVANDSDPDSGDSFAIFAVAQVMDTTTKSAVLLDSNAMFQFQFMDNGSPGANDTLAMTIWNSEGGLWFASN